LAAKPNDGLGRFLGWADRWLAPIETAMNFFGGFLIFCLMFLGMTQIVLRVVFSAPIFGYIDFVEFSMVAFAILGMSYVQRLGGHVRMEIVVSRFSGRTLWLIEAAGELLAIVIVTILIPYSYFHFERAFDFGDSTIDIELPTWPGKLAVPFALTILLLRLLIQFFGFLRLAADPQAEPVGVPSIKSVEQLAEEEIEGAR
jgi:TRAP-type C4-dicarboxylate transport system permease small subunit